MYNPSAKLQVLVTSLLLLLLLLLQLLTLFLLLCCSCCAVYDTNRTKLADAFTPYSYSPFSRAILLPTERIRGRLCGPSPEGPACGAFGGHPPLLFQTTQKPIRHRKKRTYPEASGGGCGAMA